MSVRRSVGAPRRRVWVASVQMVLASAALTACGASVYEERTVGAGSGRTPYGYARVTLPAGTKAVAVWAAPDGGGVAALDDGRFVQVDRAGAARVLERVPGEAPRAGDAPARSIFVRGYGTSELLALVPAGALLVQNSVVRSAQVPAFLTGATAFTLWGGEALWGAADGLYASDGARWVRLDDGAGAVRNVSAVAVFSGPAPGPGREAWVVSSGALRRVRYEPGAGAAAATVRWIENPESLSSRMGAVRFVAAMSGTTGAAATERGLAVFGPFGVRWFEREARDGIRPEGPSALEGGGGFAWTLWNGDVLRTDGDRVESLATGVVSGPGARLAVDPATGTSALLIDGTGALSLLEAEETLRVSGFVDGITVFDPLLELAAVEGPRQHFERVKYLLDGNEMAPVAERTAAPWGWGPDGARALDVPSLRFGAHEVTVIARTNDGVELRRSVRFAYNSPLGRVPSYARDVGPIYEARCARCHSNSVAIELAGYQGLRRAAPVVRQSIRERRMPPDLLLDPTAAAIITAWIDGAMPE